MNSSDPSPSCRPTKVEVPKELPKVSMVNTSLKKLKHHIVGFDVVVKERTMATAIIEGSWGFKHTKACFRDEIIPFVKALKDLFNTFNQYLIDELSEEKVLVITTFKDDLRKLKEKALVNNEVTKHPSDPEMLQIRVKPSTSASGSQPLGNTKKDKIRQTTSSTQKNKVEAHPRKVESSLKNKDCVVAPKGTSLMRILNLNMLSFGNQQERCLQILDIWRPTGRTFTIVGNACPLTMITTTTEVPFRKPTSLDNETSKLVVTLVYSQKHRKSKTNVLVGKSKVYKSVSANKKEPRQSWGSIVSDVPSSSLDECRSSKLFSGIWTLAASSIGDRSQLTNFVNKFLGTVKFRNDHVAKILGYGDYQIGNVTISRVYYMEGLGHNLFSVRQFCDSNLEVAFRQHTCFIHNLEGVDLLTGSRGNNLYTLSFGDMIASSPICLLLKALKTKS
ncbi:hypothetical protein Tco_0514046 [Tanacetum coccineum]